MKTLGNLIWLIFGGFILALAWLIVGIMWCVSIIGIPIGVQCFKFAQLSFWPFGSEVVYGGGAGSLLVNILWLIFGGIELALLAAGIGIAFSVTIIGIPFGLQCFKIAQLALMPVGARVRPMGVQYR